MTKASQTAAARRPRSRRALSPGTPEETIWIGTSGWTYDGWRGPFYPEELSKKAWLRWYATQFASTEINGSFYRTPSLEAVAAWRLDTPPGFLFSWKASKFITHWKRLSDRSVNSLELMETRLRALGNKVGAVLFQLPARFKADPQRLASFLKLLTVRRHYAFEFRDASWYCSTVFDLLRAHDVALCLSDHRDAPTPWQVTARHVYLRGHGPTGQYRGRYSLKTLQTWAGAIAQWQREGRRVYCYFDNDVKSAAPRDARRLMQLLAELAGRRCLSPQPDESSPGRHRRRHSGR